MRNLSDCHSESEIENLIYQKKFRFSYDSQDFNGLSDQVQQLLSICACHFSRYKTKLIEELLCIAERYVDGQATRHEMNKVHASFGKLINESCLNDPFYYFRTCKMACDPPFYNYFTPRIIFSIANETDNPHAVATIPKIISSFIAPTLEILPEHKTSTVTTLANHIYNSKDWGSMPILADALQDTGYNQHHLNYLRDTTFPWRRGAKILELLKTI